MIKETNINTQKIDIDRLADCLKEAFNYTNCHLTKGDENTLVFSYTTVNEPYWWDKATFIIKQPVVFLYDEFGNLLAYGTPDCQDDFEINFAKACYKILNEPDVK